MADRARRAEFRVQRRYEAVDSLGAVEDPMNEGGSDNNEEMEEVRVPQRGVRGPVVVPPFALDPGMWI